MSEREDILYLLNRENFNQNRAELIGAEIIRFIRMHWIDMEEQSAQETNNNPNFMQDKDIKYHLYPFYINWKKIEERKNTFYDAFAHFGYFGASVFSNFKTVECPFNLTYKNIIYTFSSLCYEYLMNLKDKEEDTKDAQAFMKKLPDIVMIFKLIKKKIIMYKEIPIYIIILKIYEIYYLYNVEENKLIELLKYQYLLISYLKDEEYKEIFKKYFNEKVRKIYEKMVDSFGKRFELPNSKKRYINHIKYIYESLSKSSKDNAIKNMKIQSE